jgi:hypothetical protein
VPEIPVDPEQMAVLRARLGVTDGEPDPTMEDLRAVLAAEQVVQREYDWLRHLRLPDDDDDG